MIIFLKYMFIDTLYPKNTISADKHVLWCKVNIIKNGKNLYTVYGKSQKDIIAGKNCAVICNKYDVTPTKTNTVISLYKGSFRPTERATKCGLNR